MRDTLAPNQGFPALSADNYAERYNYSNVVTRFDPQHWKALGWRHVFSYRHTPGSELAHKEIAVRESTKDITTRLLPIHVEHRRDGDFELVSWYTHPGAPHEEEPISYVVHSEAHEVCRNFMVAALDLEQRGIITICGLAELWEPGVE